MSSSNRLLLSLWIASAACAGVERADSAPRQPSASEARPAEIARELERREAYLASRRDGAFSVGTAVLSPLERWRRHPALGMAVLEVKGAGLALRVAADLSQGTHHVYLLGESKLCAEVDPEREGIVGSPEPDEPGYLGALENVRDGSAVFERLISDETLLLRGIVGRPLVLVHAHRGTAVCGVFRETDARSDRSMISER